MLGVEATTGGGLEVLLTGGGGQRPMRRIIGSSPRGQQRPQPRRDVTSTGSALKGEKPCRD